MKLEYCCQCGEATGRAGAGDDSLYTETGGPFCESCFPDAITQPVQPAPRKPITADMVTDEMLATYFKDRDMFIAKTLWPYKRRDIAAAVNAYITNLETL